MCLIIAKPVNVALDMRLVGQSVADNRDGWGIVYTDADGLHVSKGMESEDFMKAAKEIPLECPALLHTRIGTSGTKDETNCHPFKISQDIVMMHNGIINISRPTQAMSDTWHFAHHVVKPMIARNNALYGSEAMTKLLGKAIGMGSKLAFIRADGAVMIVNQEQGLFLEDGTWVSNTRSMYGQSWYVDGKNTAKYDHQGLIVEGRNTYHTHHFPSASQNTINDVETYRTVSGCVYTSSGWFDKNNVYHPYANVVTANVGEFTPRRQRRKARNLARWDKQKEKLVQEHEVGYWALPEFTGLPAGEAAQNLLTETDEDYAVSAQQVI